jgi:hypothetical protein
MPIEYIVGTVVAVTLKLRNTIKALPNLPIGESIALSNPPTSPLVYPAFHSGTKGAEIDAAAPRHWRVI